MLGALQRCGGVAARRGAARRAARAVASAPLVSTSVDAESPVAVLTMARAPVNSLNRALLADLEKGVRELETTEGVRGFVLATAYEGRAFSAGLDLLEMYQRSEDDLAAFWTQLHDTWLALYETPLATVAAVEGTAPAGGTLLALSCDYRVLAADASIKLGLNEAAFGLVAPEFFLDVLNNTVDRRTAERLATTGSLLSPGDALEKGLADAVEPADAAAGAALRECRALAALPFHARAETKRRLRAPAAARLRATREGCVEDFIKLVQQAEVQDALGAYVASLKAKEAKRKAA